MVGSVGAASGQGFGGSSSRTPSELFDLAISCLAFNWQSGPLRLASSVRPFAPNFPSKVAAAFARVAWLLWPVWVSHGQKFRFSITLKSGFAEGWALPDGVGDVGVRVPTMLALTVVVGFHCTQSVI